MKIVEVIPQLSSGGGERFTIDLCNELVLLGHDVWLIVLFPVDKRLGFFLNEISHKVNVVSLNKGLGIDISLFKGLRKLIGTIKPDVIHTHLRALNYIAPFALLYRKTLFCHTIHSAAEKEASDFASRNLRRLLFKSKRCTPITISDESLQSFVEYYGMDAPMIVNGRNVPSDLEPSQDVVQEIGRLKRSGDSRIIVNLARLMDVKRQPLIAKVCKRLEDEGYMFDMLMIGRDDNEEYVKEILSVGAKSVHILGQRSNPLEYLAVADAYCLMSSYEGMPISLIEALGVGALPVCTPVGGIVNVIDNGSNGLLAENIDEESCYMVLKQFLDMSDVEIKSMQSNALRSYEPFSMTDCAKKYIDLFQSKIVELC